MSSRKRKEMIDRASGEEGRRGRNYLMELGLDYVSSGVFLNFHNPLP